MPAVSREIGNREELAKLPNLSVVVFRGAGMQLAWQLDKAWFAAGDTEFMFTRNIPDEAFPAIQVWEGEPRS
ncbi:hypothetical protein [Mycobacteroides abscessus]|uniref:hypothetical protein n=1 Tax=Mycobacteroides abscessus TaxID=36809 RepID=UPI00266B5AF6|nr:hypothetical protein [Mycobacteroides abscessus]MDO3050699.1 hypothetical protein [Mycobacteroides abscessus subsp. abscessus]